MFILRCIVCLFFEWNPGLCSDLCIYNHNLLRESDVYFIFPFHFEEMCTFPLKSLNIFIVLGCKYFHENYIIQRLLPWTCRGTADWNVERGEGYVMDLYAVNAAHVYLLCPLKKVDSQQFSVSHWYQDSCPLWFCSKLVIIVWRWLPVTKSSSH